MAEIDPVAPATGRVTLSMGVLAVGALCYAAFYLWEAVFQALRFGSPDNAITYPLQASPDAAVPPDVAPDAFGYFATATLSSSAVTWWPQAWLSTGAILGALVHVAVAVLVVVLARRAMRGRLVHGGLSSLLLAGGLIVAVGGSVAQGLSGWGLATARAEVIAASPGTLLGGPTLPVGEWLPLLLGLAVVAVALAIRAGERAQRDAAGLV